MATEAEKAVDAVKEEAVDAVKKEAVDAVKEEAVDAVKKEAADDSQSNGSTVKVESPSSLESRIIKQIEYYFGDINLSRDKFLQLEIRKDEGWVPLSVLLTFNRLKQITTDPAVICGALRKSSQKLMQVHEDGDKIRRDPSKPLPENTKERRLQQGIKSVHVKGFPLDTTLDAIESFINQHGEVESTYMKRNNDDERTFKGSCWFTFHKLTDAQAFVEKEEVKYDEEHPLRRLFKEKYWAEKKAKRVQAKEGATQKRLAQQEKRKQEEKDDIASRLTKGAVIKLWDLPEDLNRDDLKSAFSGHDATVAWVDYESGDKEARIRFQEANRAATVINKMKEACDGKLLVKEKEIQGQVLDGEEELAHWTAIYKDMDKRRRDIKRKRKDFRQTRGRRMGPKNKRRRRDDEDDDEGDDGGDDDE